MLAGLPALKGAPPPPPGPQERRSQNNVAFAIAGVSLAYAVEQKPEYLDAAKQWTLAAIDYEPWGYTYNKPNVDLAAGHLLYAIGWAYDLLYHDLTEPSARASARRSSGTRGSSTTTSRPGPAKRFNFTQNHDFIPTAGLAVTALALMGESADAPQWAALARAHHHRAGQLLSPDGYYYEGMEYWIFSTPWLVHFLDAWEHATGESLWEPRPVPQLEVSTSRTCCCRTARTSFDFGDIWEGAADARAGRAPNTSASIPGGTLQSNFNVAVPRRRAPPGPRGAGGGRALRVVQHSQPRGVLDAALARPATAAGADGRAAARASLRGLGRRVRAHVVGARRDRLRVQGGPARGPSRGARCCRGLPSGSSSSGHAHPDAEQLHHLGAAAAI